MVKIIHICRCSERRSLGSIQFLLDTSFCHSHTSKILKMVIQLLPHPYIIYNCIVARTVSISNARNTRALQYRNFLLLETTIRGPRARSGRRSAALSVSSCVARHKKMIPVSPGLNPESLNDDGDDGRSGHESVHRTCNNSALGSAPRGEKTRRDARVDETTMIMTMTRHTRCRRT